MNILFSISFLLALFSVHMYFASKHAYEDIHFKLTMNRSSPYFGVFVLRAQAPPLGAP